MAEGGNATGCSEENCKTYSILNNHPRLQGHSVNLLDSPVQGDIFDATQFCEAFFHVPKVLDWETNMQCLDEENCRIYDKHDRLPHPNEKGSRHQRQPKNVVSFVVLKRGDDVEYKAMYENCQSSKETKHAEEFFVEDANGGKLKEKLDVHQVTSGVKSMKLKEEKKDSSSNSNSLKLYMYITLQPCHKSTVDHTKSCTETLINLYRDILEPLGIEFIVKPTFIYKAYWSHQKSNEAVKNAKEGLKKLYENGVKVEAMEEKDWTLLRNELCRSERTKVDARIKEFLTSIEQSTTTCNCPNKCAEKDNCRCNIAVKPCEQACTCKADKCKRQEEHGH